MRSKRRITDAWKSILKCSDAGVCHAQLLRFCSVSIAIHRTVFEMEHYLSETASAFVFMFKGRKATTECQSEGNIVNARATNVGWIPNKGREETEAIPILRVITYHKWAPNLHNYQASRFLHKSRCQTRRSVEWWDQGQLLDTLKIWK